MLVRMDKQDLMGVGRMGEGGGEEGERKGVEGRQPTGSVIDVLREVGVNSSHENDRVPLYLPCCRSDSDSDPVLPLQPKERHEVPHVDALHLLRGLDEGASGTACAVPRGSFPCAPKGVPYEGG